MDTKLMALFATANPTEEQILVVARLSPAAVARLSPAAAARLSPDQVVWLSPDQVARLSPAAVEWLSPAAVARLSPAAVARLKEIPIVENLYSKMLSDIKLEQRKIDQSTFGLEDGPADVCGSPMCIGGHTVNIAGEAGYKLRSWFGFETAARLIHRASRPDVSPPRYDSYPNEWALAYIEERAAEEVAAQGVK